MSIQFRKEVVEATILNPMKDFQQETKPVEFRWDPLTNHTARIIEKSGLRPESRADISEQIEKTKDCFFCPGKVEKVTPRILPEIASEDRIKVGEAILFPNLSAYDQYGSVSVFSCAHFLTLAEYTPELVANNLKACLRYIRCVHDYDPTADFCSINWNVLPPSGSSLIHPHVQTAIGPFPTTMQRILIDKCEEFYEREGELYWHVLSITEKEKGERYLGTLGRTHWLTSFAPIGFSEVRSVVRGVSSLVDLSDEDMENLADGISRTLRFYYDHFYNSINMAIYSGPLKGSDSFRVNLRLNTRSNFEQYYRSDATYFERLHWEAMIDESPEELCANLKSYFG